MLNGYFLPFSGRRVRPEHLAAPIVFGAFVLSQVSRRTSPIRVDAFAVLSLAWVAVNALSSWAYAPNPSESFVHVLRMGFLAMTFLTVANLPLFESGDWIRRVRLWLVLGGIEVVYAAFVATLARSGGPWLPGVGDELGLAGISVKGTQMERNLLGIFAATLLAMSVYWLAAQRRTAARIAENMPLTALGVFSSMLLVLSMTRSAWIAVLAAGPLVYLLFDRRWLRRADRPLLATTIALPLAFVATFLMVGLLPNPTGRPAAEAQPAMTVAAAAAPIVTPSAAPTPAAPAPAPAPSAPPPVAPAPASAAPAPTHAAMPPRIAADVSSRLSTFKSLESDFTVNTRLQDARWAIDDWRVSPWIGRGSGSFAQIHGIRVGTEAWISNLVLHTLVDTGLVGLTIQMSLFLLIAVRAWRLATRTAQPTLEVGLKGLVLGLVVMLIAYQVTDGSWMALFWIHLGLIVNGIYSASDKRAIAS